MKITIQTDQGPHDISPAYETAVRGLVAHRAFDEPEWWTLTHLATGRSFGVDLPRLKDVRHCVDLTVAATAGPIGWVSPMSWPRDYTDGHRAWTRQYQTFATTGFSCHRWARAGGSRCQQRP
jgi:hypothetical protein